MNLFDCLKEIITEKKGDLYGHPDFSKAWSNYMIVRYLSMDPRFFQIATIANNLQTQLSSKDMYLFLVKHTPYSKNSFIKYITKPKTNKENNI